jgi:predicted DNA-binding transcriptional regulator YafY
LAKVPFKPNTSIDFGNFFDDIVGVSISYDDVEKEMVILRFTQTRFPYVTSKPIHKSQIVVNEDECTISLEVKPTRELEQQILSFGPDVEVLFPAWFRDEIAEKIADCVKKYSTMKNDCIADV